MTDFYVDFGAAGGGNGTFATPWNRISSITGVTASDVVWVRRVSYTDTTKLIGLGAAWPNNVPMVGWPKVGDSRYASRPVAAQAAWDSDVGDYAEIIHSPTGTIGSAEYAACSTFDFTDGRIWMMSRISIVRNCAAMGVVAASQYIFGSSIPSLGTTRTFALSIISERCKFTINRGDVTAPCAIFGQGSNSGSGYSSNSTVQWDDVGSLLIVPCVASGVTRAIAPYGTLNYHGTLNLTMRWRKTRIEISGQDSGSRFLTWGNSSGYIQGYWKDCECVESGIRTSGDFWSTTLPPIGSLGMIFSRCLFQTASGAGSTLNRFDTLNAFYSQCSFIGFNALRLSAAGGRLDARKFIQGAAYSGSALQAHVAGVVTVGQAVFASGNTKDIDCGGADASYGAATVDIRSVTEGNGGTNLRINGRIVLRDMNGNVGTWKRLTLAGTSQVHAGVRTGGGAFSYQLIPAGVFGPIEGVPTHEPGLEDIRIPLTAPVTVTVYGVHEGYGVAPDASEVWLEVEYATTSGRTVVSSRASVGTALTADGSSWTGISGSPVGFKLNVSLTDVDIATVASVRVWAAKNGGNVFVDPKPQVS